MGMRPPIERFVLSLHFLFDAPLKKKKTKKRRKPTDGGSRNSNARGGNRRMVEVGLRTYGAVTAQSPRRFFCFDVLVGFRLHTGVCDWLSAEIAWCASTIRLHLVACPA